VYWPRGEAGCSVVHGNLEVKLMEDTSLADFTVRRLQLHKVRGVALGGLVWYAGVRLHQESIVEIKEGRR